MNEALMTSLRFEVAFFEYSEDHPYQKLLKRFYPNYVVLKAYTEGFDVDIETLVYLPAGMYSILMLREDRLSPDQVMLYLYPRVLASTRPNHIVLGILTFESLKIPFPTNGGILALPKKSAGSLENIGKQLADANS